MSPTLIRSAHEGDIGRLHEIAHDAYLIYVSRIGKAPAPMLADFAKLVAAGEVWVIDQDPVPGYIALRAEGDRLRVDNVAVDPREHGMGYGRRLLDFAEEQARAGGYQTIRLFTNVHMTENRSLYPALGYRETGRKREDGFDRVYFEKPVDRAPG